MRVLLVDDNEELRGFLSLCLSEEANEVVTAEDAEEVLKKVQSEKFDALIIDSIMEKGDGISLTEQIRSTKNGRSVPILLMSSVSTALARRMAQSAGCTEFLVKPFGQMQFLEQVKNLR